MSKPTYRVDLDHTPEDIEWPWSASVVRLSDELPLFVRCGNTREQAFERAQAAVKEAGNKQSSSVVLLTEDGDILDPHEVQR